MPLALIAAFAGSLAIHTALLFLPDVELSTAPEPPPLLAEIKLPPRPAEPVAEPVRAAKPIPSASPVPRSRRLTSNAAAVATAPADNGIGQAPAATTDESKPLPAPKVLEPQLPARGRILYTVFRGDQGLMVGRAVHEWEFADGAYRIRVTTETSGLAAFFKPIRIDMESRGKFGPSGLQPERFTTRRNGAETNENADFDWTARQVTLARDGRRFDVPDGAQDVVSFHYQLALVPQLAEGASMGVVTGKKYERYRFDSLGEESLELPVGVFRTLHVRVQTDSTTEIWLALDRQMLPVKIRHTDRKGESFEQIAVEFGNPTP